MSKLEQLFESQIISLSLPEYQREYKFARNIVGDGVGIRQRLKDSGLQDWRIDFAWPDHKLFVEINGGTFVNGRHNRGSALTSEYRKINAAHEHGNTIFIYDSGMIKSGEAARQIERVLISIEAKAKRELRILCGEANEE